MAFETKSREINGRIYHVTELPAKQGRAMLVRLIKVLGPVFGQLVSGSKPRKRSLPGLSAQAEAAAVGASVLSSVTGASVGRALAELSTRLTEQDLEWLCTTLGEYTEVQVDDERRPKLSLAYQNLHFAGRYLEMFGWIGFALEVNFSDFFEGSAIGNAIVRAAQQATETAEMGTSRSESRPVSIGRSGE